MIDRNPQNEDCQTSVLRGTYGLTLRYLNGSPKGLRVYWGHLGAFMFVGLGLSLLKGKERTRNEITEVG